MKKRTSALGSYEQRKDHQTECKIAQDISVVTLLCDIVLNGLISGEIKGDLTAIKQIQRIIFTTQIQRKNITTNQAEKYFGYYTNLVLTKNHNQNSRSINRKLLIKELVDFLRCTKELTTCIETENSAFEELSNKLNTYGFKRAPKTIEGLYYGKVSLKN